MTKTICNIEFLNVKIHEMHGILDSCNYKNNSLCNNVMAMCRPSILSLQHMSLSSLPVFHNGSLLAHSYSYFLSFFFQQPWGLWLRDLSNPFVLLATLIQSLVFSFLFSIVLRCTLGQTQLGSPSLTVGPLRYTWPIRHHF